MKLFLQIALISLNASCCFPQTLRGAEVTGPVTQGSRGGPFSAPTVDVAAHGYVVEEYFLDGKAHAYEFKESSYQTADGRWSTQIAVTSWHP